MCVRCRWHEGFRWSRSSTSVCNAFGVAGNHCATQMCVDPLGNWNFHVYISVCPQFDANWLMLDFMLRWRLTWPSKPSQIVCTLTCNLCCNFPFQILIWECFQHFSSRPATRSWWRITISWMSRSTRSVQCDTVLGTPHDHVKWAHENLWIGNCKRTAARETARKRKHCQQPLKSVPSMP